MGHTGCRQVVFWLQNNVVESVNCTRVSIDYILAVIKWCGDQHNITLCKSAPALTAAVAAAAPDDDGASGVAPPSVADSSIISHSPY
jgi:poly-beta-hydroxyalkanoate depolymerase